MDDEHVAPATLRHGAHEVTHEVVALHAVHTDAVLDRHRQVSRFAHGRHAVRHQGGLALQASAKGPTLHPRTRAAAVQVDLVVAPLLRQPSTARQIVWLTAAQLQCHRVLFLVEVKMPRHIAMQQRTCGHHLGVEQRAAGDEAMEEAAVPICPIHHRRDAQAPGRKLLRKLFAHDGWVLRVTARPPDQANTSSRLPAAPVPARNTARLARKAFFARNCATKSASSEAPSVRDRAVAAETPPSACAVLTTRSRRKPSV